MLNDVTMISLFSKLIVLVYLAWNNDLDVVVAKRSRISITNVRRSFHTPLLNPNWKKSDHFESQQQQQQQQEKQLQQQQQQQKQQCDSNDQNNPMNVIVSKYDNTKVRTIRTIRGGQVQNKNTLPQAILGSVVLALIEKIVKEGLAAAKIRFPAGLGACLFLFGLLMLLDVLIPSAALRIFEALSPGSALLAKWLPVMFVPGLVMLPLSPSIGGSTELVKMLATITIGFIYTVITTITSVVAIQTLTGKKAPVQTVSNVPSRVTTTGTTSQSAPKPFSDETWNVFWVGTLVSGVASLLSTRSSMAFATLLQTIFLTFVTGTCYVWSARLPTSFVQVVHPLVTSSILILLAIRSLGICTNVPFLDVLRSYKTGKLMPLQKTGAGDLLMYALGPSVVSFAIAMYSRKNLLFTNLPSVITAMLVSSIGGLFGTAYFVRLINLGGKNGSLIRLSVLARNITTALALPLTAILGGDLSIAAAVVCFTGIVGASYGKSFLNYLNVHDPLVRGLAIGSSAQGLGVASLANELDAFPFAAIAMVLTAIAGTTLASIPSIQKAIIAAATG